MTLRALPDPTITFFAATPLVRLPVTQLVRLPGAPRVRLSDRIVQPFTAGSGKRLRVLGNRLFPWCF